MGLRILINGYDAVYVTQHVHLRIDISGMVTLYRALCFIMGFQVY